MTTRHFVRASLRCPTLLPSSGAGRWQKKRIRDGQYALAANRNLPLTRCMSMTIIAGYSADQKNIRLAQLTAALLLCLGVLGANTTAQAQDFGEVEETNSNVTSYFFFVEPGEAVIEVKVMGTVRQPGLYRVNPGIDLGTLLALSGGPVLDVRDRNRDRETTIRLFRPQGGGEQALIFEDDFEGGIATRSASYPVLQDGDVMTVEVVQDRTFEWRDAVSILSAAATVVFAIGQFAGN